MISRIIVSMALASILISCNNIADSNDPTRVLPIDFIEQTNINEHNAQNSLDWMGTYEGTLPCADCEGIKTIIELNQNCSFTTREEYLNKPGNIVAQSGRFEWDKSGMVITLIIEGEANNKYKVVENALIHLDMEGNEIKGSMAHLYRLGKK
jgi:uncharacterized lipoprotein NlpE involved in copper resistance